MAIILVSYFMILLDNSVIFTALPALEADLHLSTGELTWVQDAYTLVFGGLLLLAPGLGTAVAAAVPTSGTATLDVASEVSVALTTGSALLPVALIVSIVLVLPQNSQHAARRPKGRTRTRVRAHPPNLLMGVLTSTPTRSTTAVHWKRVRLFRTTDPYQDSSEKEKDHHD